MTNIETLLNDYYTTYKYMTICDDDDDVKNELHTITNSIYQELYDNLESFATLYPCILDEVNAINNRLIMYCASICLFNLDYIKILLNVNTQETKYLYVLHIVFALYEAHKDLVDEIDENEDINTSNENIIEMIKYIYDESLQHNKQNHDMVLELLASYGLYDIINDVDKQIDVNDIIHVINI